MTMTTAIDILNKGLKLVVETNNVELLPWIFAQGRPTNVNECLLIAIEKDYKEMVTTLVAKITTPVSKRPLMIKHSGLLKMSKSTTHTTLNSELMATLHEKPEQALADLNAGIISIEEINYQNGSGWTVLMYLCRNASQIPNSELIIQKLLDLGADINLDSDKGTTALMLAAHNTKEESNDKILEILLKHPKILVNKINKCKRTALDMACGGFNKTVSEKTVEMLLAHPEIDVNLMNPLRRSCMHSIEKIVEMFLKHPKIDVNQPRGGGTVLIEACGESKNHASEKVVELLLNHPAIDVNAADNFGVTALINACKTPDSSTEGTVQMLLKHPKIQVNLASKCGWTALGYACFHGKPNLVDMLLKHPGIVVDPRAKMNGRGIILYAFMTGNMEVTERLIKISHYEISLENDFDELAQVSIQQRKEFLAFYKKLGCKYT